tara:strand:- start:1159 stop:1488 length:330 start_codon:yes stop_codon:yes gene_type:complete
MNFNTAKQGLNMLVKSGLIDADVVGIFSIFTSNFVLKSKSIRDWANRVYFSFLISQIRDYFINNPKLFLIYFKEEYSDICKGEILTITNGLINTHNLKIEQLIQLVNVL